MLRFFRQIRQRLLHENQFSKYLLYAIGEIILVVLGILIALQINAWNEERKDRNEETQVLLNLQNELERNQLELLDIFVRHERIQKESKYLLEKLGPDSPLLPDDTLRRFIRTIFDLPVFLPINNATNSMIATGQMDLIQNEELKKFLSQWEFYTRRYVEESRRFASWQSQALSDYLKDKYAMRDLRYWDPYRLESVSASEYEFDTEQLQRDPVFENLVEAKRTAMGNLFMSLAFVKNKQTDILAILSEELRKRDISMQDQVVYNDLRITGFGLIKTPGFRPFFDAIPMEAIDPENQLWEIELELAAGTIIFKNRLSWYDLWVIDGFPKGNLIHHYETFEDAEEFKYLDFKKYPSRIEEPGRYRIRVNMKAMTAEFEKLDD